MNDNDTPTGPGDVQIVPQPPAAQLVITLSAAGGLEVGGKIPDPRTGLLMLHKAIGMLLEPPQPQGGVVMAQAIPAGLMPVGRRFNNGRRPH